MGGRAQRLPPRCIADDHDGGLCFEPLVDVVDVVVVVVVVVVVAGGVVVVVVTGGVVAGGVVVAAAGSAGAGGVGAVRGGKLQG